MGMCSDKDDNTWVITYDGVYVIDSNRKVKMIQRPTKKGMPTPVILQT